MAEPRPVYEGVVGDDGHTRMCRCGELASYWVRSFFQGRNDTFDVCNTHFRFFSRRKERLADFAVFPEYESYQIRMRTWVKRNV